jgi:hypothetical protein
LLRLMAGAGAIGQCPARVMHAESLTTTMAISQGHITAADHAYQPARQAAQWRSAIAAAASYKTSAPVDRAR